MSRQVVLIPGGSDDKIEVDRAAAMMSHLIKDMLEEDDDEDLPEIPLPNVQRETLLEVVKFCVYHVDNPMNKLCRPLKSTDMVDIVGEWDARFIDMEQNLLFNVILAANYLHLPDLLDLGCAKIASMIKSKSPDEIKELFNIEKNATPEEIEQVRQENTWIFETD